jgi:eukaryotic-like serine/threonine-protein kinase
MRSTMDTELRPNLLLESPPVESSAEAGRARFGLPPKLLSQASRRLGWLSLFVALSSIVMFFFIGLTQPEVAARYQDPVLRLIMLSMVLWAVGLIALERYKLVSAFTLLTWGMVFEVYIAFAIAMLETAVPFNPAEPIRGLSGVAAWIFAMGVLIPNRPAVTLLTATLAASTWLVAYEVNLYQYGFERLPWQRLMVWPFCNYVFALFAYLIARYTYGIEMVAHQARDLGSYRLVTLISRGGMGEVWKATHKMLARDAAIKIVRPDLLAGVSARQGEVVRRRFEREANATARLQSPHTVYLYDFGTSRDGHFYYVMELLDGVSLQNLVTDFGPQPASRVISILCQMCESLEEAHYSGLIHRDLKPSNVMLCHFALSYDFVKILDFGLVKPIANDAMSLLTVEGVSAGTPGYIAPEVAMGEPRIDARADIYGIGCLAYFLLTGSLVFTESSVTAMTIKHVQEQPVPPSRRTELPIPSSLEFIVMQCLEKKPGDRPANAAQLAALLRACEDVPVWTGANAEEWWQLHMPATSSRRMTGPSAEVTPLAIRKG